MPRSAWARSSTPSAWGHSRGTTATRKPCAARRATAGTGAATSATWTKTGWVYFAGRTSDWLRVDGENFPAAPIEAIVARHPDVMMASVYGVPDADSGDQVMVGSGACAPGARFDGRSFAALARRPVRSQPQVAAPLRPPLRGAPDHADQQGPDPHPRPREVPLRPRRWGPDLRPGGGEYFLSSLHPGG